MKYGIQLAGDIPLVSYFKTFFLLLLKCHLSKSANYNYAAIVAFAEMLSIFNMMSLSLLDDFLTLETQLRCFFLQEALLSATVAVTLPCLASRRDLLHSVPLAVSYFGFLLPLLVSSLRQVLAAGGSWARSLLCVRLCSLKMVQVHIIAVLMGFFQSL